MSGHHVVPVKLYLLVFGALMVGTVITVAAAFVDLGVLNNVVMLGIAILKATLVVLFFMHVKYSTRLIQFAITMADYLTRGWLDAGAAWPIPWAR